MRTTPEQLLTLDRQHVWHPYSSATNPLPVFPVVGADGVRIELSDGRKLIDGMSSWWSVIHGYNHPVLNEAAKEQVDQFAHVMFGGLTHEPAVRLAQQLVDITPSGLNRVFFSDSGSVSVEVALKMAMQYWVARGKSEKKRMITLKKGYHGDTWGAMAVCDPVTGMHQIFSGALTQQFFAEQPKSRFGEPCQQADINSVEAILREYHQQIAAFILEPVVQGAGGMWFYSADYLRQVRTLCDEYEVLLIADEIATGFGRTGEMFGCDWANISPDILCLGKALTGGYMSLAATLCNDDVVEQISGASPGMFMHGPTFMANPLACAVANASIELLCSADWKSNIQRIESGLSGHLEPARENPAVADVRVLGAIGVVELTQPVDMEAITSKFVENGVWIRPFDTRVYLMPPYIIKDNDLEMLCEGLLAGIRA